MMCEFCSPHSHVPCAVCGRRDKRLYSLAVTAACVTVGVVLVLCVACAAVVLGVK